MCWCPYECRLGSISVEVEDGRENVLVRSHLGSPRSILHSALSESEHIRNYIELEI